LDYILEENPCPVSPLLHQPIFEKFEKRFTSEQSRTYSVCFSNQNSKSFFCSALCLYFYLKTKKLRQQKDSLGKKKKLF